MKRTSLLLTTLLLVATVGCVTYQTPPPGAYSSPPPGRAGPKGTIIVKPSFLYLVPNFQVYFVPDVSYELFFYSSRWYRRNRSEWYWSASYDGPWTHILIGKVPGNLRRLPRDYRRSRNQYRRVPYGYWNRKPGKIGWRADYEPSRREPEYREDREDREDNYPGRIIVKPSFMYFMGSLGIYFVPDVTVDIFFYNNSWYNRAGGRWYMGDTYRGPWRALAPERVPPKFRKLPGDYREYYRNYERVPYGKWEKGRKKHDDDDRYKRRKKKRRHDDDDD